MKHIIYLLGIACACLTSACSDDEIPASAVDAEAVDTPEALSESSAADRAGVYEYGRETSVCPFAG